MNTRDDELMTGAMAVLGLAALVFGVSVVAGWGWAWIVFGLFILWLASR